MSVKLRYYLIIFIVCFFSVSLSVKADVCETSELTRLKTLANEIDVENTYLDGVIENDLEIDKYKISITGPLEDFYIVVDDENGYYLEDGQDDIEFELYAGDVKIEVYSINCDELVRTINLSLPYFNSYSLSSECETLKDYNLDVCNEWYTGAIDSETFREATEKYLEKEDNNDESKTLSFISKYYLWFIAGGVLFIIMIIFFVIRHRRRSVLE